LLPSCSAASRANRLGALLAPVLLAGCGRSTPPTISTTTSSSASPEAPATTSTSTTTTTSTAASTPPLSAYASASPLSGKSVGHTSVVFKLKLEGGLEAAYKPRSHRGHDRYKGEVAAYRLAVALGLPNVPLAIPRSFPVTSLRAALGDATPARELFDHEAVADSNGSIAGALIPWIPKLEFLPLESDEWSTRYRPWLTGDAGMAEDQRALARQISTMVVFDYLTGNWDRWSGGQIGIDRSTGTLLFLDNDGAFFDPPPSGPLASQLARLAKISRFSRSFVGKVRALDPNATRAALGDEQPGVPLLGGHALAEIDARRRRALGIIDAKLVELGEAQVLTFE
jgi:hypothetical protein